MHCPLKTTVNSSDSNLVKKYLCDRMEAKDFNPYSTALSYIRTQVILYTNRKAYLEFFLVHRTLLRICKTGDWRNGSLCKNMY